MSYTLNLLNTSQTSYIPVIVNGIPAANPEDLIWTIGSTGAIFPTLVTDQVTPAYWYHGANPPIPSGSIQVHGNTVVVSNSSPEVISGTITKGLFELRTSGANVITNITAATNAQVSTTSNHDLVVGDKVEISGTNLTIVPQGIYKVISVVNPTDFTIDYDSTAGGTIGSCSMSVYNYLWDEVYTTPMGLYNARPDSIANPGFFEFFVTGDNSNELLIYVNDPNIIPKVDDVLILQRFFQQENSFVNSPTTDGINSIVNFTKTETYEFKIKSVSADYSNPLSLSQPYAQYTIVLDKSFAPIIDLGLPEKYLFVLLNRKGTTVDRELFTDTWKLTQVYRSQLIGDPYNFTGVTQPKGRANYLYYKGAELLGVQHLLAGVIPAGDTPFVVLDFADEIKDRIYNAVGEFEIHLPTVMLQGERGPAILTNSNPLGLPSIILTDTNGAGTYSPLYMKYSDSDTLVRYGWVLYDLRVAVIDHSELATVMGYNANRNFTLSLPEATNVGNTAARPTPDNPILITNASNTSPIVITTLNNHNLVVGDQVSISGVTGNIAANVTTADGFWYVNVIDNKHFALYNDSLLSVPVDGVVSAPYAGGGSMYGRRLAHEYFFTYRIKGIHYNGLPHANVIPFNWQYNGSPSDLTTATLDTKFDTLTHLVDVFSAEGFEADEYEVIIGKYTQDLSDPYAIAGIEDVVVMPALGLKDLTKAPFTLGAQNTPDHTATFTRNVYDIVVNLANTLADGDANNPKYDILNVNDQKHYNLTIGTLPETLLTSEGEWTIGLVKYKSQAQQYRMTMEVTVPAGKWNGTQNPSFVAGDPLMNEKLITEVEFLVTDSNGDAIDSPYIYAKISPPIKKNNINDLILKMELDF